MQSTASQQQHFDYSDDISFLETDLAFSSSSTSQSQQQHQQQQQKNEQESKKEEQERVKIDHPLSDNQIIVFGLFLRTLVDNYFSSNGKLFSRPLDIITGILKFQVSHIMDEAQLLKTFEQLESHFFIGKISHFASRESSFGAGIGEHYLHEFGTKSDAERAQCYAELEAKCQPVLSEYTVNPWRRGMFAGFHDDSLLNQRSTSFKSNSFKNAPQHRDLMKLIPEQYRSPNFVSEEKVLQFYKALQFAVDPKALSPTKTQTLKQLPATPDYGQPATGLPPITDPRKARLIEYLYIAIQDLTFNGMSFIKERDLAPRLVQRGSLSVDGPITWPDTHTVRQLLPYLIDRGSVARYQQELDENDIRHLPEYQSRMQFERFLNIPALVSKHPEICDIPISSSTGALAISMLKVDIRRILGPKSVLPDAYLFECLRDRQWLSYTHLLRLFNRLVGSNTVFVFQVRFPQGAAKENATTTSVVAATADAMVSYKAKIEALVLHQNQPRTSACPPSNSVVTAPPSFDYPSFRNAVRNFLAEKGSVLKASLMYDFIQKQHWPKNKVRYFLQTLEDDQCIRVEAVPGKQNAFMVYSQFWGNDNNETQKQQQPQQKDLFPQLHFNDTSDTIISSSCNNQQQNNNYNNNHNHNTNETDHEAEYFMFKSLVQQHVPHQQQQQGFVLKPRLFQALVSQHGWYQAKVNSYYSRMVNEDKVLTEHLDQRGVVCVSWANRFSEQQQQQQPPMMAMMTNHNQMQIPMPMQQPNMMTMVNNNYNYSATSGNVNYQQQHHHHPQYRRTRSPPAPIPPSSSSTCLTFPPPALIRNSRMVLRNAPERLIRAPPPINFLSNK